MTQSPNITIGIDIGLSGAIAFFDTVSKELLTVYPMPVKEDGFTKSGRHKFTADLEKLLFHLEIPKTKNDSAIMIMEDVHAFPGQGVVSVGTLLWQKGVLEGFAQALGYSKMFISPKTWQNSFGIVPPKDMKNKSHRKSWLKNESRMTAKSLYPDFSTKFDLVSSHGLSDAVLIGKYYLDR